MDRPTPAQIRGARGMLDWSMGDLAEAAGLSVSTVKRMEMVEPQPLSESAYATVRSALEASGVRFLFDGERGRGVWFDHG